MSVSSRCCATCQRGWTRPDGAIGCGAPVNEDALRGYPGVNPVWAERKYGRGRLVALLANDVGAAAEPAGSDAENMNPADGYDCKMWQEPEFGNEEDWIDLTVIGSPFEVQISRRGGYRHRPLKLGRPQGPFDLEERGIGPWRPGQAPGKQ